MASIAITDRFIKIDGIPVIVPMDYWMNVIKKQRHVVLECSK